MTESIPTKKFSGLPPGRCIHTQPGGRNVVTYARITAARTTKDVGLPRAAMRRVEKVLGAQEGPSSFVDNLPFVGPAGAKRRKDQLPRDFWHNVKSTGDYDKDGALGSQYAYLVLQAIKAEKFQPLLGWIVLDMIEHRCPEPIVVGFFQTIADVCLGLHQIPAAHVRLVVPK